MKRQHVFEYVKSKYNTIEEYPWIKFPAYAVLRHQDNTKWFGVIMNVPANKLGLTGDKVVDVLNVKCDPHLINILKEKQGFFQAYHMNKKNWISILLDDSVAQKEVTYLIDKSYEMTK